jgi:hypothetical protein
MRICPQPRGRAADPKIASMAWYRPRLMREHAMQSASVAQGLTKGARYEPRSAGGGEGKGAAAALPVISPPLSERRRFPPRNRNSTCSCPDLSGLSGTIDAGSSRTAPCSLGDCASQSNSKGSVRGRPHPSRFGTDVLDSTSIGVISRRSVPRARQRVGAPEETGYRRATARRPRRCPRGDDGHPRRDGRTQWRG